MIKKYSHIIVVLLCIILLFSQKSQATFMGVVSLGQGNRVVIIKDHELKSRVVYYPQEELENQLRPLIGTTVLVTGVSGKKSKSRWKSDIQITKYEVICIFRIIQ